MKTLKIAALALLALTACHSNTKQNDAEKAETETAVSTAMEIDDVLAKADSLVNTEFTIQGVCTHTCAHGATKIFLMGSDDTKTIRVEAGELGSFDKNCVNSLVQVTGKLEEQRVDEAYLQQWEEKLKNQTDEKHGNGKAGCDSEKKARGETAGTPEERIKDFRTKIADRKAKEGKDYLSFYYFVAKKYEIK